MGELIKSRHRNQSVLSVVCVCSTPSRQLQRLSRHYLVSQMSKPIKRISEHQKVTRAVLCFAIYVPFSCRGWVFVFSTYVAVVVCVMSAPSFLKKKKIEFI